MYIYIYIVGATGCACSDLRTKLSKQFTVHHNVGMKGCVRFLFSPYFLPQFSVSPLALSAVISTFLLCITRLPQHSAMYLQQ